MTTDDLWELFDEPIPDRNRGEKARRIVDEYKAGIRTIDPDSTITCRVCGQRETRSINVTGLLCTECRSDIPATVMLIDQRREAADAAEQAARERWRKIAEELDDVTAARMARLMEARHQAEQAAQAARTSFPATMTLADAVQRQRAAESRLSEILLKIERSRQAGDALSTVILEEDRYLQICRDSSRERYWCDIAMQEIDAVFDAPPF